MSEDSGRRPSRDADGASSRLRDLVDSHRYASAFLAFEAALFALAAALDALAPNGTEAVRLANLFGGLIATFAVLVAGAVALGLLGAGGWVVASRP